MFSPSPPFLSCLYKIRLLYHTLISNRNKWHSKTSLFANWLQIDGRWHGNMAPDRILIEDAGPQSKERPSRLHILTYSRIHDNTTGLCHWIFDWQMSKCHPLPVRYTVRTFCILMCGTSIIVFNARTHAGTVSAASQGHAGHAHFFGMSVCICFYFFLNWHHAWLSARSFT